MSTSNADPLDQITEFASGFSLEATLPTEAEIEELRGIVPPGTRVFLSAVPSKPLLSQIAPAILLRRAGLEPVPHIAARNFPSRNALEDYLARISGDVGVQSALVIAGDRDTSAGPFHQALDIIASGLLARASITTIAVGGYPDGHPRIPTEVLDIALAEKRKVTAAEGLDVEIVTQFTFDSESVRLWINRQRAMGYHNRIRIGVAGPAGWAALLRYAKRCGVRTATRGAARNAGMLSQIVGGKSAPDGIITELARDAAGGRFGPIGLHYFSFGGIAATGRWASQVGAGQISFVAGTSFTVNA